MLTPIKEVLDERGIQYTESVEDTGVMDEFTIAIDTIKFLNNQNDIDSFNKIVSALFILIH
jgi:hypothetical protein